LEVNEVYNLINAAFVNLKINRKVSQAEVNQFIHNIDVSKDGKIQKNELYVIFKRILG
jgi:Ca2+-binding EF-hand superfamily protein